MTDRLKGNLLVLGQFVLLGLLLFYPSGSVSYGEYDALLRTIALACLLIALAVMVIAAFGLGKSLTAHPIPNKQAELKTSGIYSLVRHPIYSGLILIGFSLTLSFGIFPQLLFFLALLLLLNVKARFEERLLTARFPEYSSYQASTGRFLPRLRR